MDAKEFLEGTKCVDEEILSLIKEMDFPYPLTVKIAKSQNITLEVNNFLENVRSEIPKTFGSGIIYIIGELTDNIEQHSGYFNAFVLIKPEKENLSILIFDDGLSIPYVFEKKGIIFSKDSDAINMALEGKTTKEEEIPRGYGLRTIKSLVKALSGELQIISRKAIVNIQDSTISLNDTDKGELKGTLIHIKLKTPKKDLNIYPYLE